MNVNEHFKELLQHFLEVNEEGYEKLQSECLAEIWAKNQTQDILNTKKQW
jgi:hypothetical protein